MNVREYMGRYGKYTGFTFIKARARKDAHTPYYHAEYQTTPIWDADEWLKSKNTQILDSIVLNDKQASITWLSGVDWNVQIKAGIVKCLLIITPEDFELLYPGEQQRQSMEKFIEGKLF